MVNSGTTSTMPPIAMVTSVSTSSRNALRSMNSVADEHRRSLPRHGDGCRHGDRLLGVDVWLRTVWIRL